MIVSRTRMVTETTWVADDGTPFATALEASAYEARQTIATLPHQMVVLYRQDSVIAVHRFATRVDWDRWVRQEFAITMSSEPNPSPPSAFPATVIVTVEENGGLRLTPAAQWLATERYARATVATAVAQVLKEED